MTEMFQNIILTFSNGKEIIATTKEFMKEDEELKLEKIQVTAPRELPEGIYFEEYDA